MSFPLHAKPSDSALNGFVTKVGVHALVKPRGQTSETN